MKRRICVLLCVLLAAASLCGIGAAEETLTANEQALLDAMVNEADERVGNAGKPAQLSAMVTATSQEADYPAQFDLRAVDTDGDGVTENYVTSIKEQHPFGTCWAFASISAAETSILYELRQEAIETLEDGTRQDTINLSEHHLAWFAYTPIPEWDSQAGEGLYTQADGADENPSMRMSSGSTQFAAASVFASGMGPVAEPDFDTAEWPESALNYHGKNFETSKNSTSKFLQYAKTDDWSIDESQRYRQTYMLEDTYFLPSPVYYDENDEYSFDYAEVIIKAYKEQLMNGRAVSISYCSDSYYPGKDEAAPRYINTDGTWGHYCYDHRRANHAVTIVGWDDDYPASNFLTEAQERDEDGNLLFNEDGSPKMQSVPQPERDGAWIVKNSWGSTDPIAKGYNYNEWGYEGSGYFYLSYWDTSTETAQCFDFDVDNTLKADLGEYVLEEYDMLPVEYPHSVTTDFKVSAANLFEAEENMTIRAISCTTTKTDESVDIELYVLPEGAEYSVENLVLVSEETVSFPSAGLHVVRLSAPYAVKKGQTYAVCTTQRDATGAYIFSVGSEYNQKGYDAGYCDDRYAAKAVVNPGESYVYLAEDGVWWDFAEVKQILEGMDGSTSYLTYDNFPIKVYASIDEA